MDFPSSQCVYAYWLCSAHWFRLVEMRRPKELSDMRPHTPWHWLRSEELVCALVLSLCCSFGLLTECCWCHHSVWTTTCLHELCTQIHTQSCVCWICGLHSKWRQLDDVSFSAQFSYIMSCQSESSLCLFCCFHSMSSAVENCGRKSRSFIDITIRVCKGMRRRGLLLWPRLFW